MTLAALDFWQSSGWHLCDKDSQGNLIPTNDFMAAYFERPELQLVEESCDVERVIHERLIKEPFAAVEAEEIALMKDPDIIENYNSVLAFRNFLGNYNNLQTAYMAVAKGKAINFPPLFVDQLCHIILRQILHEETEALYLRAAEILFRSQSVTLTEGRIMLADQSVVEMQVSNQNLTGNKLRTGETQIDVLTRDNQDEYWERSDNFDTAIDVAFTMPGNDALARVFEKWVKHFVGLDVSITPLRKIEDDHWSWHIGLDKDSSAILDDLYNGKNISPERLAQILCLFKMEANSGFSEEMAGKPIYLALSMNNDGVVQLKPQNLLVNLPLSEA